MLIRERECSGHFVHRGSEEKRKERDCEKCVVGTLTSFAEYNKDKVLVDVATLLVVNHVNLGVLCLCLYLCQIYRSKDKT